MAGNGVNIPKFGEWKTSDGTQPYTMYFETARKRRSNSGITPPPGTSPARIDAKPGVPRTPPRTLDAKPVRSTDGANRSRNQGKARPGGSSVPIFGEWNEKTGRDAQQYTIVFDQLQKERSAPPTPSMGQPQSTTPTRATHQDLYDNVPNKGFTCWGLFRK